MINRVITWINFYFLILAHFTFGNEGGYPCKVSYYKGEIVNFYISTSEDPFTASIYRMEESLKLVTAIRGIRGGVQLTRDSSFQYGAGWESVYQFLIPDDWTTGFYRVEFPTSGGKRGFVFIVKENDAGSYSDIAYVTSTNTFQAYNEWGGKSLYDYNSTDEERAQKVSFLRPFKPSYGSSEFYKFEYKFITWAAKNNIKMEILANIDVHRYPEVLSNYKLVVMAGHNEYWSLQERMAYEKYFASGGNIAIFSGNTCWWQVRYEEDDNVLVCYKKAHLDPLNGIQNELVTVNWSKPPLNNPENQIIGVSFLRGGYVNSKDYLPGILGYGDFNAVRTHHWVYEGTGLKEGAEFGSESKIAGIEVDGALFEWEGGLPVVTGQDLTPNNFQILAITPAHASHFSPPVGYGTMGIFHNDNGGVIFNAATTGWGDGLGKDPVVDRITFNVLNRLLENKFPPDIISWKPYLIKSTDFNMSSAYLNRKDIYIKPGETEEFSITALDVKGKDIKYAWVYNDEVIGTSENLSFTNNTEGKNILTAFVYNEDDTTSISWQIYKVGFGIVSRPDTLLIDRRDFEYIIEGYSFKGHEIKYELMYSPDWVRLENNIIRGSAPEDGVYHILLRAYDDEDDEDIQIINLYIGNNIPSSVTDVMLPLTSEIMQNFPNPFNPSTVIRYSIAAGASASIVIYDLLGTEITTLVQNNADPGYHQAVWNGIDNKNNLVGTGVYFAVFKSGDKLQTVKLMLMK